MNLQTYLFALFICLSNSSLFAETPLSFSQLPLNYPEENHSIWSLQGEHVQVRGFWYPLDHEKGILAATPDLKSCCLNARHKINQQLIVRGQLGSIPPHQVITLVGIFKIERGSQTDGDLSPLYLLENTSKVDQKGSFSLLLMLGILVVLVAFLIKYRAFIRGIRRE